VVQHTLWGGADVVEHFASGRQNRLPTRTEAHAVTLAAELATFNHARLVDSLAQADATCPKCRHRGPVLTDFGVRTVRGQVRRQSWCRRCRLT
jgi:hypothetical protein